MKFHRTFLRLITLAGAFSLLPADEPDPSQIQISVGRLLEQGHYSRRKLDDAVSKQLLTNYLEALDYNHLFYTQKDVDGFKRKFETTLDDDILLGAAEPAQVMFNTYKKRVEDRVAKVKELLKQEPEPALLKRSLEELGSRFVKPVQWTPKRPELLDSQSWLQASA